MPSFNAKDVKLLREKTGVGMMECKKALEEASGNIENAVVLLRKKGAMKAAKKSSRVAAEGLVFIKTKNKVSAILEINSETDFVAKNERFKNFGENILNVILEKEPKNLEQLLSLEMTVSDSLNLTVEKALQEEILAIGEKIKIRRFEILKGNIVSYIHAGGTIGVLVKFNDEIDNENPNFIDYGKNIAMQIAASNPIYINPEDVPSDVVEKEKEIAKDQQKNSKKPENVIEKIVEGRVKKYFQEVCLNKQEYVKDSSITVEKYTENISKKLGTDIKILKFIRMEKGEGIEKLSNNFADEISSMLK